MKKSSQIWLVRLVRLGYEYQTTVRTLFLTKSFKPIIAWIIAADGIVSLTVFVFSNYRITRRQWRILCVFERVSLQDVPIAHGKTRRVFEYGPQVVTSCCVFMFVSKQNLNPLPINHFYLLPKRITFVQ